MKPGVSQALEIATPLENRVGPVWATLLSAIIALFVATAFSYLPGDVLESKYPELSYRVNAVVLETEIESALNDPVSVISMIVFNALVFGLPAFVGTRLCARSWWVPTVSLAALGLVAWCFRFGGLLLMAPLSGASRAALFDLVLVAACAMIGAHVGRQDRNKHRAG